MKSLNIIGLLWVLLLTNTFYAQDTISEIDALNQQINPLDFVEKIPFIISIVILGLSLFFFIVFSLYSNRSSYIYFIGYLLFSLIALLNDSQLLEIGSSYFTTGILYFNLIIFIPLILIREYHLNFALFIRFTILFTIGIICSCTLYFFNLDRMIDFILIHSILFALLIQYRLIKTYNKKQVRNKKILLFVLFICSLDLIFRIAKTNEFLSESLSKYLIFFILMEQFSIFLFLFFIPQDQIQKKLKMQADLLKKEQESRFALTIGREQERNWIGKELHDDIGSSLSAIRMLQETNPDLAESEFEKLIHRTQNLSEDYQSGPKNSFKNQVFELLQGLQKTTLSSITINTKNTESIQIYKKDERILLSSIKECVYNAIKYSNCDYIEVNLSLHKKVVHLQIQDNGKGFNLDKTIKGAGLQSIENLNNLNRFKADIKSKIDKGSEIRIEYQMQ